jgi:hypothetical protein
MKKNRWQILLVTTIIAYSGIGRSAFGFIKSQTGLSLCGPMVTVAAMEPDIRIWGQNFPKSILYHAADRQQKNQLLCTAVENFSKLGEDPRPSDPFRGLSISKGMLSRGHENALESW